MDMIKEYPKYYQSKCEKLRGSNEREVFSQAREIFNTYQRRRRQPYIRSRYFDGQKVFLSMFWQHLNEKGPADRRRRIVFLAAAFDLIKNSTVKPFMEPQARPSSEYYRFYGKTKSCDKFCVQIMKDKKNNRYFMSCFPVR
jgi:hypothetical protein